MSQLFHHRLLLDEAQGFVRKYHRHSKPLKRHVFSIGASECRDPYYEPLGIVTVDRCSSAWSKRRDHIEIRRVCVRPAGDWPDGLDAGRYNVASFLIGKAKQACFAMGYRCITTYTQPHETGASLKAAGFFIHKMQARATAGGQISGRVLWVALSNEQPDQRDRDFTNSCLVKLADFQEEYGQ